jgi:hypothetical protein
MTRTLAEQLLDAKVAVSLSSRLSEADNVPVPSYSPSASMYSSVGEVLREAETAYTNNALQLVEKEDCFRICRPAEPERPGLLRG